MYAEFMWEITHFLKIFIVLDSKHQADFLRLILIICGEVGDCFDKLRKVFSMYTIVFNFSVTEMKYRRDLNI